MFFGLCFLGGRGLSPGADWADGDCPRVVAWDEEGRALRRPSREVCVGVDI